MCDKIWYFLAHFNNAICVRRFHFIVYNKIVVLKLMLAAIFLEDKLKEEKMVPKWSNNNSTKITRLRNILTWTRVADQDVEVFSGKVQGTANSIEIE